MQVTALQKIAGRKLTKNCHPLPISTLKLRILTNVTKQHRVIQRFPAQEKTGQSCLPRKGDLGFLNVGKLKWDIGTGCSERLEPGETLRNSIWLQSCLCFELWGWTRWPPAVPSYLKYSYIPWFFCKCISAAFFILSSWDTRSARNKLTYVYFNS